jgi:hypothetical protein
MCIAPMIEIYASEPLLPGLTPFEVEIAISKLKKYKSPGRDQISGELIPAGGETILPEVGNKKELPDKWKESIFIPLYKEVDKTDLSKYHGILLLLVGIALSWTQATEFVCFVLSLLSTSYKILSNIPLSRLSPYTDEVIGGH